LARDIADLHSKTSILEAGATAMMEKATRILTAVLLALSFAAMTPPAFAQNSNGTIKLRKIIVPANDNGHFNLQIKDANGAIVPGGLMQNAGNNGSIGPVTVPPGVYTVSEVPGFYTVGTDYTPSISGAGCVPLSGGGAQVTITPGAHVTCTITNTRNAPGTITVKKVTVPANDPGRFTLQITSSYPQLLANFLNAHAPATMGPVSLPSGSTYTISEVAGTGTSLSNYTQTIMGAGCINGVVHLTAGANVICTITNVNMTNPTCTGWPLQATVDINYSGISSAQLTSHICRNGKVKIVNHTSTQISVQWLSGIASFPTFPVTIAGNALTPAFPLAGTDSYKVTGSSLNPNAATTGQIVIH
jgi:hypothetical protein